MINAAILDDKQNEVSELQEWLEEHPLINFLGYFESSNDILPKINDVELLFCDIEIPTINGFDFLRTLKNPPRLSLLLPMENTP